MVLDPDCCMGSRMPAKRGPNGVVNQARVAHYRVWLLECGVRHRGMENGVWNMGYGTWNIEYEARNMEYGLWSMKCDVWRIAYGVWSLEYGVWTLKPGARSME